MTNHKPTRTDNNKAPKSGAIRKGSMTQEQIEAVAKELQPEIIQVVEPPAIEPEPQKGNYKVFAETLKAVISETGQFEATGDQLKLFFPQRHYGGQVAMHLKRYYGLSYRRVENGRNDTYVFFVEPTREELIVQLTSAESKVIELHGKLQTMQNANNQTYEALSKLEQLHLRVKEENTQLKSDLSNSQRSNNILFRFAIGAVITIIFKSVAL